MLESYYKSKFCHKTTIFPNTLILTNMKFRFQYKLILLAALSMQVLLAFTFSCYFLPFTNMQFVFEYLKFQIHFFRVDLRVKALHMFSDDVIQHDTCGIPIHLFYFTLFTWFFLPLSLIYNTQKFSLYKFNHYLVFRKSIPANQILFLITVSELHLQSLIS